MAIIKKIMTNVAEDMEKWELARATDANAK